MRATLIAAIISIAGSGSSAAQSVSPGSYLCTVEQLAGVGSVHLEGAGPPDAFTSDELYRFRLVVTEAGGGRLRLQEAGYGGPDQSRAQWEDNNSTLHSTYFGDGRAFVAEDGPDFLSFGRGPGGQGFQFYHAGFQYAGGEDESVAVRWGRCTQQP